MSNVTVISTNTTGATATVIPLSGNPFNIGFGIVVSATATYTVEHTFDGINYYDHDATDLVTATTNQDGNYAFPIAGFRLNVAANTGTVTLTAIQAG